MEDRGPFNMSRYANREDLTDALRSEVQRLTEENERLRDDNYELVAELTNVRGQLNGAYMTMDEQEIALKKIAGYDCDTCGEIAREALGE